MAWPFSGNSGGNKSADQALSEERLKILANVAIEQVPFPEQGMLTEEDAWTISPGPTKARINSQQSVPNVAATLSPASVPTAPVASATVDTSGLERLISSRLDMVEDVLRMVEVRLEEGAPAQAAQSEGEATHEEEHSEDEASFSGDRIISASGEVVEVSGVNRMMEHDEASLVELYEAQALAANPFLAAPRVGSSGSNQQTGAPTVAALLLDNMTGMAAVSFTQKAIESGMLTEDEGNEVMAIVQLADPGDAEKALNNFLSHRELLTFSALVSSWRHLGVLRGEE